MFSHPTQLATFGRKSFHLQEDREEFLVPDSVGTGWVKPEHIPQICVPLVGAAHNAHIFKAMMPDMKG